MVERITTHGRFAGPPVFTGCTDTVVVLGAFT